MVGSNACFVLCHHLLVPLSLITIISAGPLWDHRSNTLYFLDIDERLIYHYTPEEGRLQMEEFDEKIGCLALRKSGGVSLVC